MTMGAAGTTSPLAAAWAAHDGEKSRRCSRHGGPHPRAEAARKVVEYRIYYSNFKASMA